MLIAGENEAFMGKENIFLFLREISCFYGFCRNQNHECILIFQQISNRIRMNPITLKGELNIYLQMASPYDYNKDLK